MGITYEQRRTFRASLAGRKIILDGAVIGKFQHEGRDPRGRVIPWIYNRLSPDPVSPGRSKEECRALAARCWSELADQTVPWSDDDDE